MMPNPFALGGVDIVVSLNLGRNREQYRRPRSKCKRIRKKWRRDDRNWRTVDRGEAFQMGRTIYASPKAYAQIVAALS